MSRLVVALLSAVAAVAVVSVAFPAGARADPDTCKQGFVWREANPSDHVCVTPDMRQTIRRQNTDPTANQVPGSNTCVSGFVWREAFDGDTVCVLPASGQR